ncbi:phytanoyl-CoA dioxygenase family protein [Hymenobacter sp. BT188]|uniref:phytanoyl-CoA dioxygenase family protein n=1 Tax=Hymenobacter sp. BT188 TaxID=2763504 RepID=UPI001651A2EB|nr:phytanoyl-CoA dioxygenase family protein [Hymenobacter sp. BT188]MBC6608750.1 phytanoyl-CoA dioxygenase family protein [Hymenobacter sp. BT188]
MVILKNFYQTGMEWIAKYTGFLRRIRLTYWLFNLSKLTKLSKNKELYRQFGINKAIWKEVAHADIKHNSTDIPWMDREDITSDAIRQHPQFATFSPQIQEQLLQWPEKGFIIIPGLMTNKVDELNSEIDDLKKEGKIYFNFTGKKIFNAWQHSTAANQAFNHPVVTAVAKFIFQKEVIPFQTVNFIYGSGEKPHSDSIHFTTEPLGYLTAMWLALQDIVPGSGELLFYPGSHKLAYVMSENFDAGHTSLQLGLNTRQRYEAKIEEIIQQHHLTPCAFTAQKGDVLMWHANLLHAGSPITNAQLTRKSFVAHYFAKGVLQYHEITQRPAIISRPAL